jgi:hypothetical protein
MARCSLLIRAEMATRRPADRRCSYVVLVQHAAASAHELKTLAQYLSALSLADCDVVVLDPSPRTQFDEHARILRWVGRHVAVRPEHRAPGGIDVVRAASVEAACEKVIVAAEDIRYTPEAVAQLCDLLEAHEVVEPQDYLDPMPWWGGIETGRILLHRGIEPQPDHGATFGFRRSALRALRALGPATTADAQARRLAAVGAEVHPAADVFVRREPGALADWIASRPRSAGADFVLPMKSAFFFAILPLLAVLLLLGGARLAGGYLGMLAFASVGLALRGRAGASSFFPLRACLFAPVWVLERSVSVYWALLRKVRGAREDASLPLPDRAEDLTSVNGFRPHHGS